MSDSTSRRHKFTEEEDACLCSAVLKYGTYNWARVAAAVPSRDPRQCRERWTNYLNPNLTSNQWTATDDALLLSKVCQHGRKWQVIECFFPGRSQSNLRNRFRMLQRKASRLYTKAAASASNDPLTFLDRIANECEIMWET
jgi:hypothetical protein